VTSCEQGENKTSSLIASDAGTQTRVEEDSAAQDVPEARAAKPEAEERISKLEQVRILRLSKHCVRIVE
jgi:hypothetical protein